MRHEFAMILACAFVLSLVALHVTPASAAEIIAHRGASADAPENTLSAMKLGYAQDADAGELDIHLTKDGQIVVIHDADTKRVAGVDRKVVDQTLDEMRKLDVGSFGKWAGRGTGEPPPTLDEALAVVPNGKGIFIEIKVGNEILPALEASLKKAALRPSQTTIITFKFEVAAAAKKRFPELAVYWLHGYAKDKKTGEYPRLEPLIEKAKTAGLDGLNLNFQFPLDAAAVQRVKAAGLKLYVWTVDDLAVANALAAAGVDGITTNTPAAVRRALAEEK